MTVIFKSLASVVTSVGRIIIDRQRVWSFLFPVFLTVFLLIAFLFSWFTVICVIWKFDLFDDESDNDGSGSGSAGTCAFPFCSDEYVGSVGKSVGRVRGVSSGIFVPTWIESIGDIIQLVLFVPKGVNSKDGWLIETFLRSKSWFPPLVSKSVLEL